MAVGLAYRPTSAPERLGLVAAAGVAVATVYPSLQEATGLGLPCPLRTITGVPCPLCGMTTATIALADGRWGDALTANPLVLVLAALAAVMAAVIALRATGRLAAARPWAPVTQRRVTVGVGALAAASWVFQLHRLDRI